ncbi:MAG: tRNA-intron lyase [Candidatus Bathyarchaeota archaeon]|nr:MAG: tRNA-intron lyase [Candidatus Bathyarchaeota archaeon]
MTTQEIEGILVDGEVTVRSQDDANLLFQSGYGTRSENHEVHLSRCETLYLVAEKRLRIIDCKDLAELSFRSLLAQFKSVDSEIWRRYLIFRDLRSRGYVVKEGLGWGVDFRVYERGKYHTKAAKYVVFALCEGDPIQATKLRVILRSVQSVKKKMIVAVLDRRSEIVYYALSQLNLQPRSKPSE